MADIELTQEARATMQLMFAIINIFYSGDDASTGKPKYDRLLTRNMMKSDLGFFASGDNEKKFNEFVDNFLTGGILERVAAENEDEYSGALFLTDKGKSSFVEKQDNLLSEGGAKMSFMEFMIMKTSLYGAGEGSS